MNANKPTHRTGFPPRRFRADLIPVRLESFIAIGFGYQPAGGLNRSIKKTMACCYQLR